MAVRIERMGKTSAVARTANDALSRKLTHGLDAQGGRGIFSMIIMMLWRMARHVLNDNRPGACSKAPWLAMLKI
jgi:hypothetical protein